jgi:hypothetical protein
MMDFYDAASSEWNVAQCRKCICPLEADVVAGLLLEFGIELGRFMCRWDTEIFLYLASDMEEYKYRLCIYIDPYSSIHVAGCTRVRFSPSPPNFYIPLIVSPSPCSAYLHLIQRRLGDSDTHTL